MLAALFSLALLLAPNSHPGHQLLSPTPHAASTSAIPNIAPRLANQQYDSCVRPGCCAEQFDAALGMYYLRARWYLPRTGRFLTQDKYESPSRQSAEIWEGSAGSWPGPILNGYTYTSGDPVNFTDRSGFNAERATILAQVVRLSGTVMRHVPELVRYGPFRGEFARPYLQSTLVILQMMLAKAPVADRWVSTAMRWDVPGFFRGRSGTWELVVDLATNTIIHFNFR